MAQNYVSSEEDAKEYSSRYRLIYGLIGFTFFIFLMRLWDLQILNGAELHQFSEQNSIKETKIAAPRGIIYDRNGEILVENLPGFELTISPQYMDDVDEAAIALSKVLKEPPAQIIAEIAKSRRMNGPFRPVRLKDNLSHEEIFGLELLKLDIPGIDIRETVVRAYPLKQNGAQLFGYVGEISKRQLPIFNDRYQGKFKFQQGDMIGKAGLEEYLDSTLRGRDGSSIVQVDARGRETAPDNSNLLGSINTRQDAVSGNNVQLTIDKDVQEATFKAFSETGRIGGAVAMKTNGEILALVNAPSYDPNDFATGITPELWSKLVNDPNKPLRAKAVQDHNSPGSTFKPLIAVAALAEKVVTPATVVACPGAMKFGNRLYHDSEKQGHGNLVISQALEQSANIFFYKMGIALGIDKMFKYCDALGVGHKTGIDLPGETAGLMPNSEWKKNTLGEEWQPGENLSNAIGQGFILTTPLQLTVAYNAIGTEGLMVRPMLVRKIMTPENKVESEFQPTVLRDLSAPDAPVHIDKKVFQAVKEGLRLVVNGDHGTGRGSRLPFVEWAGKTGTSQVMSFSASTIYNLCEQRPFNQRHNGWFIGYAPADNPEVVVGVLAEHSCHGASGAAPVAREMIRAYFAKYHPDWMTRNVRKNIKPLPPVTPAETREDE